jgi:hypothetical protein
MAAARGKAWASKQTAVDAARMNLAVVLMKGSPRFEGA